MTLVVQMFYWQKRTRGHQECGDDDHHFSKFAPVSVETVLRQDPLDLSFWSFLTLHHGIEKT